MSFVKPEDILPDGEDFIEIQNQKLRKGTVAAALANARILEDPTATEDEKAHALKAIHSLVPALIALKMHDHVTWRNPLIQRMIEDEIR